VEKKRVRITHRGSDEVIAEGPVGWGITPFEGNWYIASRYLRTDGFRASAVPGLCPYKFIYLWLHFRARSGEESRYLGWRYVVPNPLLPFIAFRVAVPGNHPDIIAEVTSREAEPLVDSNRGAMIAAANERVHLGDKR
jgi:uncharacterized protein (DUF427 family)